MIYLVHVKPPMLQNINCTCFRRPQAPFMLFFCVSFVRATKVELSLQGSEMEDYSMAAQKNRVGEQKKKEGVGTVKLKARSRVFLDTGRQTGDVAGFQVYSHGDEPQSAFFLFFFS